MILAAGIAGIVLAMARRRRALVLRRRVLSQYGSTSSPNGSDMTPDRNRRPPGVRLPDTVRLTAAGAGMLLGDLEHRILEAAWSLGRPVSARELHERVAKTHRVVYITSVTVANRLVQKGILRREKRDDIFHYSATLTRDEFSERASRHVVQRIVGLGSTAVSASLVDVLAERDPEQLAELGRLVRRKLKERSDAER